MIRVVIDMNLGPLWVDTLVRAGIHPGKRSPPPLQTL